MDTKALGSFDPGRLTLAGWLVFLVSAAAAVVAFLLWDAVFPPPGVRGGPNPAAIAAFGAALGLFFGAKALLALADVKLMRPRADRSP